MTAVLLIVSWFAFQPRRWKAGLVFAALGTVSYMAVRLIADNGAVELRTNWEMGLSNTQGVIAVQALIYLPMLAIIFLAAFAYWQQSPKGLRRATLIIGAVYLPLWWVYAVWAESRLLMPMLILVLPILARYRSAGLNVAVAVEQSLPSGHTVSHPARVERRLPASPEYAGADAGKGVGLEVPEAL